MKEQYVGDENDYRKYALLRHLGAPPVRLGVCWMLTPPDDGPDGGKKGYLQQPDRWQGYDPALFDELRSVAGETGPLRLRLIENGDILPGAKFFNEYLSDRAELRTAYFASALTRLETASLIFFDPDNGIQSGAKPKGRANSGKFIYRDEIAETYGRGHSVLVYQHRPKLEAWAPFMSRMSGVMAELAPDATRWAFRTPHTVFLLLVHPNHVPTIGAAAASPPAAWDSKFISAVRLG